MTGVRDPLEIGPVAWNLDPVRGAIVEARLADLRRGMRAASPAVATDVPNVVTGPAPRRMLRRARVRVGHALVSLGSFVAGAHEHPDTSAMRAV